MLKIFKYNIIIIYKLLILKIGPDANAALYPADNVWFGFNRLSINDLTPSGMQPM